MVDAGEVRYHLQLSKKSMGRFPLLKTLLKIDYCQDEIFKLASDVKIRNNH